MKRGVLFFAVVLIFLVFEMNFALSIMDNYYIQKSYGPNQTIVGWVNISFENEQTNSSIEDSFGNKINLLDLIKNSSDYKYKCNVQNCKADYSASNEQTAKTFSIGTGEKKILGFKLAGNVNSINSINFSIASNAGVSCANQLEIDVFSDEIIDFMNDKSADGVCLKNYGKFDDSKNSETYILDSTPYCQKIELDNAPAFKIGALIKKDSGAGSLKMSLYKNGENIEKGNCNLADPSDSNWQEISCDINYSVLKKENYYVCIFSEDSRGDYKIKGYSDSNGSGFHGTPTKKEIASYKIFAQAKNFAAFGNLAANNKIQNGETFSAKAQEYLSKIYGTGIDCSSGCIIPISFKSNHGASQNIELKDLEIKYLKESGIVTETKFYDLSEIPSKINSDYGKLSLDNGKFYVPDKYGNETFTLKINNQEIFSEDITIEKVPVIKSVSPLSAPAGVPTKFAVNAEAVEGNVTKFEWYFEDEIAKQTTANSIIYTFETIGTHEIKIKITDGKQRISEKTFEIEIESPEEYINSTLIEKQKEIEELNKDIKTFSTFEQKILNRIIDIEELNANLTRLQREYSTQMDTEEEYINLTKEIVAFDIPKDVWKSRSISGTTFYSKKEKIDLDLIQEIGKGSYESNQSEDYEKAILSWNQKKLNVKMDFKEISATFSKDVPLARFFSFTISEKDRLEKEIFLVLPRLENLEFEGSYNEKETEDYSYILVDSFPKTISFSTTEDVDFTNLAAFVSPSLNELPIEENVIAPGKKEFNWWILIAVIVILIFILIYVYIWLSRWYKNNYENYLFKNKNNLYNISAYIEKSKKEGKSDSEIYRNLKKAGWDSEQASYAMKKHAGKKVGMFEISFGKKSDEKTFGRRF